MDSHIHIYNDKKKKEKKTTHICAKYLFSYLLRKFQVIFIHILLTFKLRAVGQSMCEGWLIFFHPMHTCAHLKPLYPNCSCWNLSYISVSLSGLLLNKGLFVAHPQMLRLLHLACYLAHPQQGVQRKAHTAFANGQMFEPLTINISVSQTINIIYILPKCFLINGKLLSKIFFVLSVFCHLDHHRFYF